MDSSPALPYWEGECFGFLPGSPLLGRGCFYARSRDILDKNSGFSGSGNASLPGHISAARLNPIYHTTSRTARQLPPIFISFI